MRDLETASLKITLERNGRQEAKALVLITDVPEKSNFPNLDALPAPSVLFESIRFYSRSDGLICAGLFIKNGTETILVGKGDKLIIEVI